MLKLTVAVLTVALAGTAGAAGWRDLKIDGSSEAAFNQSLAVFKEKLSPERNKVFGDALMDIWIQGTLDAKRDQREFTVNDYYQQLDGLSYEEVVTFTDPTGDTAKERYRAATREDTADQTLPVAPWQGQYRAPMAVRDDIAHDSLDSGELMRTRQGGTVMRDGRPISADQPQQPK